MAIISISGYAGSGKDTVGRIIQYLHCYNPENISVTEAITDDPSQLYWLDEQSDWKIKKWAGKLKEVASILTGIPVKNFENQEFKKKKLPKCWDVCATYDTGGTFGNEDDHLPVYGEYLRPMTVREFLQYLGTDALRDGLHDDVWVNALMADYKPVTINWDCDGNTTVEAHPNWIITDTRFPNEINAVKQNGGVTIQVIRKKNKAVNDHVSEISLDDAQFDYVIENDGTIEDLVDKVKVTLEKIKHGNA